jgi:S1-C subfamily serine protease
MTNENPYPDSPYRGYFPQYGGGYYPYPPAPQPPARSSRRRGLLAGVAVLAAAAVIGGVAAAESGSNTVAGSGSIAQQAPQTTPNGPVLIPGNTNGGLGRNGTSTSVGLATAAQQKGVVTIVSVLKYQNAESAGTGMVLTSDGEVLTNNHVIQGATSVTATVASTGRSYRADIVGTDPTDDVAVLQLRGASGLTTAKIGDSAGVSVGDSVVGVGNAGGTGTLRASKGTVTGLDRSITATDESGQNGERLTGLIEVNAPIISGDSGGPLYDSSGDIVGMDTAASSNPARSSAYAIPIDDAVKIAGQIESGVATSKIHIGLPAFLGVGVANSNSNGALVEQAIADPAISAGIDSGSVITGVGNTKVASAAALKKALSSYRPGQRVSISWTGANGASHTATLTLSTGPAD